MGNKMDKKFKMTIVDNVVIKGILGQGSFGVVHRVQVKGSTKEYAMKTMFIGQVSETARREAFNEITALSQCEHPNIIKLIGYEETKSNICYMMEIMKMSLEEYIRSFPPNKDVDKDFIVKVFYQAVEALGYLARKFDINHRDIKPHNILLDENMNIRLSDFGSIKMLDGNKTKTGTIVGTNYYIAPEIAKAMTDNYEGTNDGYKAKVNYGKTDAFSLGLTILRMIGGQSYLKYQGLINTCEDTMKKFLSEIREKIPLEIYDTLMLMLSYDPSVRLDVGRISRIIEDRYAQYKKRFSEYEQPTRQAENEQYLNSIKELKEDLKKKEIIIMEQKEEIKKLEEKLSKTLEEKNKLSMSSSTELTALPPSTVKFRHSKGNQATSWLYGLNENSKIKFYSKKFKSLKELDEGVKKSIEKGKIITHINLDLKKNIPLNKLKMLLDNLSKLQDVVELNMNLSENGISEPILAEIVEALQANNKITLLHLNLSKNEFGESGVPLLAVYMKKLVNIKHIHLGLSDNKIGNSNIEKFADSLKTVLKLQYLSLDLSGTKTTEGMIPILEGIKKLPNLTNLHLNLKGNGMEDTVSNKCFPLISKLQTIKYFQLNLEQNALSPSSMKNFGEMFKKMSGLTHSQILLKSNKLGDDGIKNFIDSAKFPTSLISFEIDFTDNQITDAGMNFLSELAKILNGLQNLKITLAGNQVTAAGQSMMASVDKKMTDKKGKLEVKY